MNMNSTSPELMPLAIPSDQDGHPDFAPSWHIEVDEQVTRNSPCGLAMILHSPAENIELSSDESRFSRDNVSSAHRDKLLNEKKKLGISRKRESPVTKSSHVR
jgi:hypothetical protein